ncbi:unnamed protein product [Effrenium voratum]|nr:unnamed protein product [Effrenium voratum]
MGAEPPASRWRQLMDRVRRSLLPESNGKTDEALEVAELASSTALHLFRQRSILQEEWIASFQPGRASLPTLLALGCPPPRGAGHPAAKSEDICSGFSKSSGSSKGSGLTTQASFWGHLPLLNRCYSSILRRCSRGRDAAPPAEDESGAQSDAWPISYQEAQEAWLQAFMELSLAGPRDWPNHRFLRGARTVPTLEMQSERPVTGGPGPLIELLYLIGEKDAQNEAKVLLREPRRGLWGRRASKQTNKLGSCQSPPPFSSEYLRFHFGLSCHQDQLRSLFSATPTVRRSQFVPWRFGSSLVRAM